jgi:hypothetical protein
MIEDIFSKYPCRSRVCIDLKQGKFGVDVKELFNF